MHVAIRPVVDPAAGGTFHYGLTMVDALRRLEPARSGDRFSLLYHPQHPLTPELAPPGSRWDAIPLPSTGRIEVVRRARRRLGAQALPSADAMRVRRDLQRRLRRYGVELLLYPAPLPESFESGLPFVIAIHDLQHRLQPEFPEVAANGQLELREYLFRNASRHATLVLADSDVGREDILNFYEPYGLDAARVKVLPFLPAHYLAWDVSADEVERVRRRYGLPEAYLFYPAKFWPHKNHVRIVEALGRLARSGTAATVVFTGGSSDELARRTVAEALATAGRHGIDASVRILGQVSADDMSALYAGARALVMPTFFGPTNIPVLEAWALGCPVLTSDIRGIREQVGDAGVLVDPKNVDSIAAGIARLWADGGLRRELAARGRARLALYGPDDYRGRLGEILDEAEDRVRFDASARAAS